MLFRSNDTATTEIYTTEHTLSLHDALPISVGASATPSRVFKGVRMAGRMGGKRVTQLGLKVHSVDPGRNLLLIAGSVPGPKNGLVEVRS